MKTYARYNYTFDFAGQKLGGKWYEVEAEKMVCYPSGKRNTLILNGIGVKADHCEIIQVFER